MSVVPEREVPVHLRVHLTHAYIQHVADVEGIDVIHLKGPALQESLLPVNDEGESLPRMSTDADVLVRPGSATALLDALKARGAHHVHSFKQGSPFEHAATVWFDHLGYADVHRFFPGIGVPRERAFDLMWADREVACIANRPCAVPSERMHRLIMLLHAARSGTQSSPDKVRLWDGASHDERAALRALAHLLDANVAFSAAIGELDEHKDAREYDLWDQFSRNPDHSRTEEWRARIKAARSPWRRIELAVRALRVNSDRLADELGHRPTAGDVARAWADRVGRAVRELRGRERE